MLKIHQHETRQRKVVELQSQIRQWERGSPLVVGTAHSTGCAALDALLPAGGVRPGSLVEWVGEGLAGGAGTLSLAVAKEVCPKGRPMVLIDPRRHIYPAALAALGWDLGSVVIIRPSCERETLWACEEALRCEAVGLVWAELDDCTGTSFRRLRLAAEQSRGMGLLLRPEKCLKQPSWAEARLAVQPQPSADESLRLRVEVVYRQGGSGHWLADIQIDSMRGTIHEVSERRHTDFMSLVS